MKGIYKLLDRSGKERKILEAIEKTGSLKGAAELLGLSYKTIWNHITRLNNIFGVKIVETKIGGEEGGGAYLTKEGKDLLKALDDIGGGLERILKIMGEEPGKDTTEKLLRRYMVRTSARNQLAGKVIKIKKDKVNAQIEVETKEGEVLTATITLDSLDALGIKEGVEVYLLIKATLVVIGEDRDLKLSARNSIPAIVKEVVKGPVNCEVILETEKGTELVSIITSQAAEELELKPGKRVRAIFKASHVIVGV